MIHHTSKDMNRRENGNSVLNDFTHPGVSTAWIILFTSPASEGSSISFHPINPQDPLGAQNTDGQCWFRILNDCNKATVWASKDGNDWQEIMKDVDVSTYHHNVYKGFFALRPAYFLAGDAKLESFIYKPL